ncbi:MAG: ABC transporter permease [Chthonomonadetes bacterium]|nr:ABC transporter permease [Chthonomonadetes bacterium]
MTSERISSPRPTAWRQYGREMSVGVFLLLLLAYFGTTPGFLQASNLRDILINAAPLTIAACGMSMVIIAGMIDISAGSVLAVCAVVAGLTAKSGAPLALIVLLPMLAGAAIGAVNGWLVAYLRIPAIIVTLGMMSVLRGGIIWYTRGEWIGNLPPSFSAVGRGEVGGIPVPVLLAMGVVLLTALLLARTPLGRHIYAVGGNPVAAGRMGISVRRVLWLVFVLHGALLGLSALVYASRFSVIQSNAGAGFELLAISAVVVGGVNIFGGQGTVWGSAVGALLLQVISTGLIFRRVSEYWAPSVQGALVLLAVVADALRTRRLGR